MSLKAFHILFIVVSTALCVFFGAWALREHSTHGGNLYRGLGLASFGAGAGLVVYGVWFLRKMKGVSSE